MKDIRGGENGSVCGYKMPTFVPHKSVLLDGVDDIDPQLDAMDFERMEKAPRFGKPRDRKRRDTHFNYNRGWDANIGYEGGKYKRKHNQNHHNNNGREMHYQQTRKEYEDSR